MFESRKRNVKKMMPHKNNFNQSFSEIKTKKVPLSIFLIFLMLIAFTAVILICIFYGGRFYYLGSLLLLCMGFLFLAFSFEKRERAAAELVLVALFCALAVVGRAAFYYLPSFKAITAVIILGGVYLGRGNGFLIGVCSAFISNFIFGQGPWTPWQMLSWGLIGFFAGVFFFGREAKRVMICIYGFLSVFLIFGAIMNPASVLLFQAQPSWNMLITSYMTGFPFDFTHAISTLLFLLLLAEPIGKKLRRAKRKYGVF